MPTGVPIVNRELSNGIEPRSFYFRFSPNGAGAVDQTTITDLSAVQSVTRTGAGAFLVTLNFPVAKRSQVQAIIATAQMQDGGPADLVPQIGSFQNLGTTSNFAFTVRLMAAAVATDMAPNADSTVTVGCEFDFGV